MFLRSAEICSIANGAVCGEPAHLQSCKTLCSVNVLTNGRPKINFNNLRNNGLFNINIDGFSVASEVAKPNVTDFPLLPRFSFLSFRRCSKRASKTTGTIQNIVPHHKNHPVNANFEVSLISFYLFFAQSRHTFGKWFIIQKTNLLQ